MRNISKFDELVHMISELNDLPLVYDINRLGTCTPSHRIRVYPPLSNSWGYRVMVEPLLSNQTPVPTHHAAYDVTLPPPDINTLITFAEDVARLLLTFEIQALQYILDQTAGPYIKEEVCR
jgi:hypothetical protein